MSIENCIENKKSKEKNKQFLGKKIESSNLFSNIIGNIKPSINQCKICNNKKNLIKCFKCSSYYCKECLKGNTRINLIKKGNKYVCSICQNNASNFFCYICGNQYEEKNLISYKANEEQKRFLRMELLIKGLSLIETDEEDILKIKNNNQHINICENCHIRL